LSTTVDAIGTNVCH